MNKVLILTMSVMLCSVQQGYALQAIKKAWNDTFHPVTHKALHDAAKKGNVAEIKRIVAAGVSPNALWNYSTPLGTAALFGHIEAMNALIDLGAHVNPQDQEGVSPLMSAVISGRVTVAQALLQHGARIPSGEGDMMLARAALMMRYEPEEYEQIINLLLRAGAQPGEGFYREAKEYPEILALCTQYADEYKESVEKYRAQKAERRQQVEKVPLDSALSFPCKEELAEERVSFVYSNEKMRYRP